MPLINDALWLISYVCRRLKENEWPEEALRQVFKQMEIITEMNSVDSVHFTINTHTAQPQKQKTTNCDYITGTLHISWVSIQGQHPYCIWKAMGLCCPITKKAASTNLFLGNKEPYECLDPLLPILSQDSLCLSCECKQYWHRATFTLSIVFQPNSTAYSKPVKTTSFKMSSFSRNCQHC